MALFHEGTLANSGMETSNFAHVIFQNMGKSYLPHAALECSYTLSQYIKPHPKDWVGIFKVGWSSARDYHTFLWSPLPENHVEGTTVSRSLVFQGYYVPGDDGEFYQFCYVTHKGEIRGASTPFQFRVSSPTDDLLTMEDDNSDILVVTTKAGFLEKKLEDLQKENEELSKEAADKQKEKEQILEERKELERACEREKVACCQLKTENQELLGTMRTLQEEREEAKRRHAEEASRVAQLEQDLIGVTQKGLQKETELDCLRDRVKKLTQEKDALETQLQNERDEKGLYKVHLKNRELENTKLMAELQVLKSVDVNKENTIVQLKEEVGQLEACVAEKEKLQREILAQASATRETDTLKEKLRQAEEQLQSTRQQAAMLASELRDASSARDRSASELYRVRQELEELRTGQGEACAECGRLADELDRARGATRHRAGSCEEMGPSVTMATEAELQREVEDLKLRLQMAGEHYKEKYKECQKLQRQVAKLSEQQEEMKKSPGASGALVSDVTASPPPKSLEPSTLGAATSVDVLLDTLIQEKLKDISKEVVEKSDKYKRCKQMLSEEKERSSVFADELTKMEAKWKEQLKINENLKLQVAAEEDRYKSQVAEKGREVKELRESLAVLTKEKEKLEEELQKAQREVVQQTKSESLERTPPVLLHYPLPYPEDPPLTPLVPGLPADLQFGNPYSSPHIQDGSDAELSLEQIPRLPPAGPPSWDSDVVCIQPSPNPSRPDGLEDPDEQNNQEGGDEVQSSPLVEDTQTPFRFDSSSEVQKRCPLCEVIFPPNYEQSKFEEHVESHWKVCPMCGTQFPLDCDQGAFEEHVLTHFSGEALNFD
ncbi:tax1-binding protein 1 homolog B isoform X1 [Paramormyrops kingsleyae]|uniref:tax1-binding protein 1 homolog B isoform X1 n=1 Tax=Paramormyrops kingsleyae TaxID=1676925 RepID=UPI003B96C229